MNRTVALRAFVVAASLLPLSAASAQIWIGQIAGQMAANAAAASREAVCRAGGVPSDRKVADSRAAATQAFGGYYTAARAGRPLAAHFHPGKHARWSHGDTAVDFAGLAAQRDPFATGGGVLSAEPIGFARATDGRSALGQWAVGDAAGRRLGTYTGLFTSKGGVWRLRTLTLTPAGEYAEPVVQYCHEAGDVIGYRLTDTKAVREWREQRVAKTEAKLGRAGADPVRTRELNADLVKRRGELAEARTAEPAAIADAKRAEDARAAGRVTVARGG